MEQVTQSIKNTYFTLCELLDCFQEESDKANVGAMKHVKGIFTSELLVPVRKKWGYRHLTHFFFYKILEIYPQFQKHKLSTKKFYFYMLGVYKETKYKYNFEKLNLCYTRKDVDSEEGIIVENGFHRLFFDDGTVRDEPFSFVELNASVLLGFISESLINYMIAFWKVVVQNEKNIKKREKSNVTKERQEKEQKKEEQRLIDAYSDYCLCLAIYEIFLRVVVEQTSYVDYSEFLEEFLSVLEKINNEELSIEEKVILCREFGEKCDRITENIDGSGDALEKIRELNQHIIFFITAFQGLALVEFLNLKGYKKNKKDEKDSKLNTLDIFESLYFKKNGNSAHSIGKKIKKLKEDLKKQDFFYENSPSLQYKMVKKIFALFDYMVKQEDKLTQGNEEAIRELYNKSEEITISLLDTKNYVETVEDKKFFKSFDTIFKQKREE